MSVVVAPVAARPRLVLSLRWTAPLLLLVVCGFLFFYGLSAGELYRTENLRAIVAEQFLRSGNWIVPTLYGEPLLTKPPGMYAAIALASWPFGGVTEWTARLPSAIAATLTVLLVYWYFSRQLGRRGGLVAALLMPVSMAWLDKAPSAEIDMLQVAWTTGAILFFLRALDDSEWKWWLAALLCVAGGLLTKWTAPAFFYLTAVPLLWWRGRLHLLWSRKHLVSAGLAAALCLGWAAWAVALAGWDNFSYTLQREGLMRLSPAHHDRAYPWLEVLLHPFKLWATNLPCSAFALPALLPGFSRLWDERGRRLLQALHCWIWPNLLFWTLTPEHAARHSFPLFPGISGLAALVWIAWLDGRLRWPLRHVSAGQALVALLVVWLAVKVVFIEVVIPRRTEAREPLALHLGSLDLTLARRSEGREAKAKGELLAALVPSGETLYLFHVKDEGIMFYYGRTVRRLAGPEHLPSSGVPLYCILDEPEWEEWQRDRPATVLTRLRDEQGEPIVLVRVD